MSDFAEISKMLVDSRGAVQVKDAKDLYKAIRMMIGDQEMAQQMGKNAFNIFYANRGAVERTLEVVESFVP